LVVSVLPVDAGDKVKEAVTVTPLHVAVMVALWLTATLPAAAVNDALLEPDGTVTLAGTVRSCALLERETVTPPVPAAPDRLTLHVKELPPVTLDAGHDTKLKAPPGVAALIVTVAVRVAPAYVTVIIAA